MRARLACNGPAQSWWGLDYRRGLLKESIYPSDAMGCVWLGFCKLSRLFLVPPSAVEGRRLCGTRGRAFQQLKGSPAAWRGCGAPNWCATSPAAPSSSHLHSPGESGEVPRLCRCPLLMWHQRTLACLKVSRKLSLHFAVGFFFAYWVHFWQIPHAGENSALQMGETLLSHKRSPPSLPSGCDDLRGHSLPWRWWS